MKQSDRLRLLAEQLDFADKIQHLVKTGQISRIEAEVRRLKDFASDLLIPKPDFPAGGIVTEAGQESVERGSFLDCHVIRERTTLPDAEPGTEVILDYIRNCKKSKEAVTELVRALREIHDLYHVTDKAPDWYPATWAGIMGRVGELLKKYETE